MAASTLSNASQAAAMFAHVDNVMFVNNLLYVIRKYVPVVGLCCAGCFEQMNILLYGHSCTSTNMPAHAGLTRRSSMVMM